MNLWVVLPFLNPSKSYLEVMLDVVLKEYCGTECLNSKIRNHELIDLIA